MRVKHLIWTLALVAQGAFAAPSTLMHQGRLFDSAGAPLSGSFELEFGLFPASSGGAAEWSEVDSVAVEDGYFSTTLGDGTSLSAVDFANTSYWVGVRVVDGAELLPRAPLNAVPVALAVAGGAVNVSGSAPCGAASARARSATTPSRSASRRATGPAGTPSSRWARTTRSRATRSRRAG